MTDKINVGDRVQVFLNAKSWGHEGWFDGKVVRIDPYSAHRRFYWVEMDEDVKALSGGATSLVSVLNPKNIKKI